MDGQGYNSSQVYQPPEVGYQQPYGQQPYQQQPYVQQPYVQYNAQPNYQQGNTVAQQIESQPQYPSPEMAGNKGYDESDQNEKLGGDEEANLDQAINEAVRAGFVKKVYGILAVQLTITVLLIALTFIDSVGEWFREGSNFAICTVIGSIGMIVFCGAVACTYCIKQCKRVELFLLFGFTLSMSLLLMALCAHFETTVVIIAASLTAAVTIGLTAYSFRITRMESAFAFCGAFLFAFIGCFLLSFIFMIVAIVMPTFCTWWYILICFMGVLLFSLYLVYDTQLILGKLGIAFGIDDYVIAAMNIYLDIINLFLYILRIVAAAKGNS